MTIWIYGDVALDNYEYELPGDFATAYQQGLGLSRHPYPGLGGRIRNRFVVRKFGGAHLLARYIAIAIALWNKGERENKTDSEANTTDKGLHELRPWAEYRRTLQQMQDALAENPSDFEDTLNLFYRVSKDSDKAYRMQPGGYEGYTLPMRRHTDQELFRCLLGSGSGDNDPKAPIESPVKLQDAYDGPTLCVFNDGGTRLRHEDPRWLDAEPWAKERDRTWAVVKSHEPALTSGEPKSASSFLQKLYDLLPGRVLPIMNADDLRRNGAAISRSLSWERSVRDLVRRVTLVQHLPNHVVVTFDYDAAVYLHTSSSGIDKALLVFSTNRCEGEYQSEFHGSMPGAQTVFASVLAGLIHTFFAENSPVTDTSEDGPFDHTLIEKILTYALIAKQRMLRCGFEPVTDKNMFTQSRQTVGNRGILRLTPNLMYHEAIFALPPLKEKTTRHNGENTEHDTDNPSRGCPPLPSQTCSAIRLTEINNRRSKNSRRISQTVDFRE